MFKKNSCRSFSNAGSQAYLQKQGSWLVPASRPSIPLHRGFPDKKLVPHQSIRKAFDAAYLRESDASYYYDGSRLAAGLAGKLQGVVAQEGEPAVVTSGILQGLDLVLRATVDFGDCVGIENPAYMETIEVVRNHTPNIKAFPLDDEGVSISAIERFLRSGNALKVLCVTPYHHNPTGISMSARRRQELSSLCVENGIHLIEDLAYESISFSPSSAIDGATGSVQSIKLRSLSKTICPGIRIGWVSGSPRLLRSIEGLVKDHGHPVMRAAISQLLDDIRWSEHLQLVVDTYQDKRDRLCEAMAEHLKEIGTWDIPKGGFFLWLKLAEDLSTKRFFEGCASEGVSVLPAKPFLSARGGSYDFARLSFSWVATGDFDAGVRRIAAAAERIRGGA